MQAIAENLWTLQYSLTKLGVHINRTVTIIKLRSGELVIHSTGPFSPEDVAGINALGTPAYLVEAINAHDTFANEGRAAFPGIPYFAPEGFSEATGLHTQSLKSPPAAWGDEIAVLELAGKSEAMREYVMLHRLSRTLIVADLVFHITEEAGLGQRMFAVAGLIGGDTHDTAMPRPEKMSVEDEAAFRQSLQTLLAWDFERVIVGHGDVVETGKVALTEALNEAGFLSEPTA